MGYMSWREHYIKYIILGFLNMYYMLPYVNAYNPIVDVELEGEVFVNVSADGGGKGATEDSYYGTDWERMDKEFEKFLGEDGGEGSKKGPKKGPQKGPNRGRNKGSNLDKEEGE